MLPKPPSCSGCSLERKGLGYAPAVGSNLSKILFLGEALGRQEVMRGEPFFGASGGMLDRVLRLIEQERSWFKIDNVVRCMPPNLWLEGSGNTKDAPWAKDAIHQCTSNHLRSTLEEMQPEVVIPLGGTPLRHILQLPRKRVKVENFHGTVQRDPTDNFWVVPTFHPAYLQRGASNQIGTVAFDIMRALEVASGKYVRQGIDLVLDPGIEWFEHYVQRYLEALERGEDVWLAVDIETPDKERQDDEGALSSKDRSMQIIRINFSYHPDEGVTIPWNGPYILAAKKALASRGVKCFWNGPYDIKRLRHHNCELGGHLLDFMDAYHILQSDTPRGLGYAAAFYSNDEAWKHLSFIDPVRYAAYDGPKTLRASFGIAGDLQSTNMWDVFWAHCYELRTHAFDPLEEVGLLVDQPQLKTFQVHLGEAVEKLMADLQPLVPEELKPLYPKNGLVTQPGEEGSACIQKAKRSGVDVEIPCVVVSQTVKRLVNLCLTCGESEIGTKHRCKDTQTGKVSKTLLPEIQVGELDVIRWYKKGPFNPNSSAQKMGYILHRGHKPGKDKKTKKESTNKETLKTLWQKHHDSAYGKMLSILAIGKIKSTYVDGTFRRLREDTRSQVDGRLHGQVSLKPSTQRTSMVNPNLTNIVARSKAEGEDLATGFRKCIVAAEGCELIEADFSGIEAVETGWFCNDPGYIRLAKLGVHALVASHLIGEPADLSWPDEKLAEYFQKIKKEHNKEYNQAKRCVHGKNYGLTVLGMVKQFHEEFPTKAIAQKTEDIYFTIAPALKAWQGQVRDRANKQHYLGGPGDHPFGYRHKFYSVYNYTPISRAQYDLFRKKGYPCSVAGGRHYKIEWGEDSKRCVAFYPQSTAAGVIKETLLRLFRPGGESYIGDIFFGKSPLRAMIHDSILLEVPIHLREFVLQRLCKEMLRPIKQQRVPLSWNLGPACTDCDDAYTNPHGHLTIGIEVKVGKNWGEMEVVPTPGFSNLGVAYDYMPPEIEGDEEEDEDTVEDDDLEVVV